MAEMKKEIQEKIGQLQLIEQNLQGMLNQKQMFQAQAMEIDSALSELKDTDKAYKIVGSIMVASKKSDLEKDLKSKKEMLDLRLKNIDKQEKALRDKASRLQAEVLKEMKD